MARFGPPTLSANTTCSVAFTSSVVGPFYDGSDGHDYYVGAMGEFELRSQRHVRCYYCGVSAKGTGRGVCPRCSGPLR